MEPVECTDHNWQLYYEVEAAWRAMYEACYQAKESIKLEQYIFENDELGNLFLELFIRKAEEGVKILVLCDRFGSKLLYNSSLIENLKQKGGEIYFYHPIAWKHWVSPRRFFPRTHIKTLIVDSTIAFTGGVCFAERMRHWRDTHIRITGPITRFIDQSFTEIKNQLTLKKEFFYFSKSLLPQKEGEWTYIVSQPSFFKNSIYKIFKYQIKHAKKEIYISTSFFIPNRYFMYLLGKAVKRGVVVYLLIPEASDIQLADWVFLSYAKMLLEVGIKIYSYQQNVLHCKTMVVDGEWSTIGSANMDILSFFYNREANIITLEPKIAAELKKQFQIDLQKSKILTLEDLRKRSYYKKVAGYCGRALKLFFPKETRQ